MVQRDNQPVAGFEPDHHRAQQRSLGEEEGPPSLLAGHVPDDVLGRARALRVHLFQREAHRVQDLLVRLAVGLAEHGAQAVMAREQLVEAPAQRLHVERPVQPQRGDGVVARLAGLHLLQEPQALLREGQRRGPRPAAARNAGDGGGRSSAAQTLLQEGALGFGQLGPALPEFFTGGHRLDAMSVEEREA